MDEILRHLPPGSRVLDLGSGSGSFPLGSLPLQVVRVDLAPRTSAAGGWYVAGDARRLPFRPAAFDAVIANHSLEHVPDLPVVLAEIRRVLRPSGALYASVPDASTLTDRIYRWMAAGGGHVNAFNSAAALADLVSRATGLQHVATRPLHSSLNFLNRRQVRGWPRRKLVLFAFGSEPYLRHLTYLLRLADRCLPTRLSHYGWGLYFGRIPAPIETFGWTNVCIRCGRAHPSAWLLAAGLVQRRLPGWRVYPCPACSAVNLFTHDRPS